MQTTFSQACYFPGMLSKYSQSLSLYGLIQGMGYVYAYVFIFLEVSLFTFKDMVEACGSSKMPGVGWHYFPGTWDSLLFGPAWSPRCLEPLGCGMCQKLKNISFQLVFLPQISILLFATLYILCHIFLTRFKKPAEFTTGTFDLPAFSQSSSCHRASPRGMGDGACWERNGGCAVLGCLKPLLLSPVLPQAELQWLLEKQMEIAFSPFLLLNYFICIYFKLEYKLMTK